MRSTTLFDFEDYRQYLSERLPTSGEGRGQRSRLADALSCQSAFVSRVLAGVAHFSLEHAIRINTFLGHTELEGDYFLLLVHLARAGTRELEAHYRKQIDAIRSRRAQVSERIPAKHELSVEDQMTYYGAWYYSAVHIILLIPEFRTPHKIGERLKLPVPIVVRCLEFLVSRGLAVQKGDRFHATARRIHLPPTSPMIHKHHANWRVRSLEALDRSGPENLHYSGPVSLSRSDFEKVREILLGSIERTEPIIRDSKDEEICCLSVDLFWL